MWKQRGRMNDLMIKISSRYVFKNIFVDEMMGGFMVRWFLFLWLLLNWCFFTASKLLPIWSLPIFGFSFSRIANRFLSDLFSKLTHFDYTRNIKKQTCYSLTFPCNLNRYFAYAWINRYSVAILMTDLIRPWALTIMLSHWKFKSEWAVNSKP